MVEAWGNVLTIIGNTLSVWTEIILFDSFFPRKKSGKTYWLFVAVGILAIVLDKFLLKPLMSFMKRQVNYESKIAR